MGTKHCHACQNTFSIQNLIKVARQHEHVLNTIIHESPKHLAESSKTCDSCLYLIKAFLSQHRKWFLPCSQVANDAKKDDLIQQFLDCTVNINGTQLRIFYINQNLGFLSIEGDAEAQRNVRGHNDPCQIVSIDLAFSGVNGGDSESFTLYIDAYSGECLLFKIGGEK